MPDFSTVDFYGRAKKRCKSAQNHGNFLAPNCAFLRGFPQVCKAMQTLENQHFPITNQLLYQLSYAGVCGLLLRTVRRIEQVPVARPASCGATRKFRRRFPEGAA